MNFEVLKIEDGGYMVIESSKPVLRALYKIDALHIARLTTQVGFAMEFETEELAQDAIRNINAVYNKMKEEIK